MKERFRGFLPVVVDLETAGINPCTNALLEICVVLLNIDDAGTLSPGQHFFEHIYPFEGAILDQNSLDFIKVDPYQPLRFAVDEKTALDTLFAPIFTAIKHYSCQRAVLVGHNAWFDLLFLKEAAKRTGVESPFHSFTTLDTTSLSALVYGQTVLAKAATMANLSFDIKEAHSAIYDAQKTAELFCHIINLWDSKNKEK
jgi:ribonuclease T